MLSVRSMAEPENGTFIRNTLIEAMWIDVHNRANRLPAGASIIKKQIQELGDEFQYALIAYDEGLLTDDKTLASALWKRFFNSDCDDYQQIELLIKYVRKNVGSEIMGFCCGLVKSFITCLFVFFLFSDP